MTQTSQRYYVKIWNRVEEDEPAIQIKRRLAKQADGQSTIRLDFLTRPGQGKALECGRSSDSSYCTNCDGYVPAGESV